MSRSISRTSRLPSISGLREAVAFDRPDQGASDGLGGHARVWTKVRSCRAQFIYQRGSEAVEAARLQGRSVFKVKIRNMGNARELDPTYRMRTVNRGMPDGTGPDDPLPGDRFNIREVDRLSDQKWVYLLVESVVQ